MDLYLDLDTSWIENEEKRFSHEMNCKKTHMDSISCVFVYMDEHLSIQKVVKEREPLVTIGSSVGILNSRLLQIIQERRHLGTGMRYKIMSLLNFHVDLEPEEMHDFVFDESNWCKEVSMFNDIIIGPSVFIFHPLHSLYFFLKEDSMVMKPMKSILKTSDSRSTKKFRVLDASNVDFVVHAKSVKSRDSIGKKRTTRKNVDS
jgi:hypothetical protein